MLRRVARARLASQMIRRLRRAGATEVRYHAATFSVSYKIGDDGKVLQLDALLATKAGRAEKDRFVAGLMRTPGLPTAWPEASPLLRPILRGTTPPDVGTPISRPALPFLAEFVVLDQPETMTYVDETQLAAWGVEPAEVFATARANLSGAVLQGVASEPVVVQFVDDGDAYWTSHLLLDGWLSRLAEQVGGSPVAFAPERGTLLVTADGSRYLPELFAQAEKVYTTSPRAITPMAYASDESGRTVPYNAPAGHPLHECVERAQAILAVQEYARQARHRERAAELRLVDNSRTRAIWLRDEPISLPEADEILIGTEVVPWERARPHLRREVGPGPARWSADGWPI